MMGSQPLARSARMMIPQRCIVAKFFPHLFAIYHCPYEPKRTSHPSGPSQADIAFTRRALHDFWLHLGDRVASRSEEHTSELQSLRHLVCRLLLEKKKKNKN